MALSGGEMVGREVASSGGVLIDLPCPRMECGESLCARDAGDERRDMQGATSTSHDLSGETSECEHTCWDPKDGEICLNRVKPVGTLVEYCSNSDVQIDRQIWV